MLFWEIFFVYCETYTKQIRTLCWQHEDFVIVKLGDTCNNQLIRTTVQVWGSSQTVRFILSVSKTFLSRRKSGFTETSIESNCAQRHDGRCTPCMMHDSTAVK